MSNTLEQVMARIRGTRYQSPDALARDLADALGLGSRTASFRRGISGNVVSDNSGGTTVGVGDPAIARTSASMQHPQRGRFSQNGQVATKQKARVELDRRTLPGVVVSSVNNADTIELQVYVPRGVEPQLGIDPSTRQNVATPKVFDDLLTISDQAKAGTLPASVASQLITVTVPRPDAVDGHQPVYVDGQVIPVTTATQYDVRSHAVIADGRRQTVVSRRQTSISHAVGTSLSACCDTGGGGVS